jgi:hypothetical protein
MKQKQYMDTLKRIKDLVYEVNSLTQHVYDSDYAASRYGKELEEKKEELDSLKSELESALTVDSEVFNSAFMQYLNDENYELVQVKLEGSTVYVAKPKDEPLDDAPSLLKPGVYILSVDDKKILCKPTCKVGAGSLPVISLINNDFKHIYFADYTRYHSRYDEFKGFMAGRVEEAIKKFDLKTSNKR